jgi:hypothetical protein
MISGFLSHLGNLVERTDTMYTHLHELLDVLQNASESIWDGEHARGNLGVYLESANLITTIHILMSNIATWSELITSVSQILKLVRGLREFARTTSPKNVQKWLLTFLWVSLAIGVAKLDLRCKTAWTHGSPPEIIKRWIVMRRNNLDLAGELDLDHDRSYRPPGIYRELMSNYLGTSESDFQILQNLCFTIRRELKLLLS